MQLLAGLRFDLAAGCYAPAIGETERKQKQRNDDDGVHPGGLTWLAEGARLSGFGCRGRHASGHTETETRTRRASAAATGCGCLWR
ncbi:MAG: hypothetical protein AcusKO_03660 [Acuticoccus sp.]